MKAFLYLLILLLAVSCNSSEATNNTSKPKMQCSCDSPDNQNINYQYKDDTLCQLLSVKKKSKGVIDFYLTTCNYRTNKRSYIAGNARLKTAPSGNSETDNDENGELIPVDEYDFSKGDCSFELRFDSKAYRIVQIIEHNCKDFHDDSCPFATDKILKKLK